MHEEVVKELLQRSMNPTLIAAELDALLDMQSEKRKLISSKYATLRESLGNPGVYGRVAQAILKRSGSKYENI